STLIILSFPHYPCPEVLALAYMSYLTHLTHREPKGQATRLAKWHCKDTAILNSQPTGSGLLAAAAAARGKVIPTTVEANAIHRHPLPRAAYYRQGQDLAHSVPNRPGFDCHSRSVCEENRSHTQESHSRIQLRSASKDRK